jgi:hypothetical protein
MSFMAAADARLAEVACAQHGMFTRQQAVGAGLSRAQIDRRVSAGIWIRTLPRVFRNAAAPMSPLSRLWASVLWAGPDCALSHCSAALLWRFEGVDARDETELVVPARRAPSVKGIVVHRVGALDDRDVRSVARLPVTSPARTLIDLAAVLDDAALGAALRSAYARRVATAETILRRLDALGRSGRPGVARLREVLAGARLVG